MTAALYFLRAFWKPLVILGLLAAVYSTGYLRAKRACNDANLKAEITELRRQADAANSVLARAAEDEQARMAEIELLTEKVEGYESSLGVDANCRLSDDDADRLRAIR